jgi:hypothetical protein
MIAQKSLLFPVRGRTKPPRAGSVTRPRRHLADPDALRRNSASRSPGAAQSVRARAKAGREPENDVRQMAVSLAGEYLRGAEDPDLLRGLLNMVDDETLSDFQRSDAYLSIARAMGVTWEELPRLSKLPPFAELADGAVVSAAKQRLSRVQLARSGGR